MIRHRLFALALAASGACTSAPVEPAQLRITDTESATYPVSFVRVVGGAGQALVLDASRFHPADGAQVTDSLTLPPAVLWPLRITLVSMAGDTLGSAATTINLESARLVTVGLFTHQGSIASSPVPPSWRRHQSSPRGDEPTPCTF